MQLRLIRKKKPDLPNTEGYPENVQPSSAHPDADTGLVNDDVLSANEHLRRTLDFATDGIVSINLNGKIIESNRRLAELLCISQELVACRNLNLILSTVIDQLTDPREFVSKTNTLFTSAESLNTLLYFKSGRVLDWSSNPIVLHGKNAGWVWSFRDLTEIKEAESIIRESETRLQVILDTLPECVMVLGVNGEFLEMNRGGLAMIDAEKLGFDRSMLDLVAAPFREDFSRLIRDVYQGKTGKLEFEIQSLNGSLRWIETNAVPLRGTNGSLSMLCVSRDITRVKLANQSVQEAEVRFRNMFEKATLGIYQAIPMGKIIAANQAMARMLDYDSVEQLTEMVPDIGAVLFANAAQRKNITHLLESEGTVTGVELHVVTNVNRQLWVRGSFRTVRDTNGSISYQEGRLEDITEQKKTEQNYSLMVSSMAEGIIIFDRQGVITECNRSAGNLFGITQDNMKGMHISQFGTKTDEAGVLLTVKDYPVMIALHTGIRQNDKIVKLSGKDGSYLWLSINAHPIFDSGGSVPTGVFATFVDISKRKNAEEKLRYSENKLSAFFRNSKEASVLLGKQFEILAFNPAARDLLAHTYEQVVEMKEGLIFTDLLFPNARPAISDLLLKALHGQVSQREFPIPDQHIGRNVWWLSSFMPAYDLEGTIFGVVANASNINEVKRAELRAKKQFDELQKANQELDRFVYSVSHDLRAPLSSIQGLINLIEMESPSRNIGNYLTLMGKNVNRLDGFIKDILDYSRNARTELLVEEVDLAELLDEIQENFRMSSGFERLVIKTEINAIAPMHADRERVRILMNNLLSNAIKYQDVRKEVSRVSIQMTCTLGEVRILFSDNGIGIRKEYLPKIFDMFYRASESSKGSGLGLYIAREAVAKLGGSIHADSVYGEFTRFTIVLPNAFHVREMGGA